MPLKLLASQHANKETGYQCSSLSLAADEFTRIPQPLYRNGKNLIQRRQKYAFLYLTNRTATFKTMTTEPKDKRIHFPTANKLGANTIGCLLRNRFNRLTLNKLIRSQLPLVCSLR